MTVFPLKTLNNGRNLFLYYVRKISSVFLTGRRKLTIYFVYVSYHVFSFYKGFYVCYTWKFLRRHGAYIFLYRLRNNFSGYKEKERERKLGGSINIFITKKKISRFLNMRHLPIFRKITIYHKYIANIKYILLIIIWK